MNKNSTGAVADPSAHAFAAYRDRARASRDLDGLDPEGNQQPNAVEQHEGDGPSGAQARAVSVAKQGGASAWRLSVAFVREVRRLRLDDAAHFTVSFTTKGAGTYAEAAFGVAEFGKLLARRAPKAGAVLVMDLSPSGRWHVHGLVMLPGGRNVGKLKRWWCHGWPKPQRPLHVAQRVRELSETELQRVLGGHHFSRQRDGAVMPGMPALYQRAAALGAFAGPWARAAAEVGLWGAPAVEAHAAGHSRPFKASTLAFAPRRAHVGVACCWCGDKYVQKVRCDKKFHDSCRRSANGALKAQMKEHGDGGAAFKVLVEGLEQKHHLLRRDAFAVANAQLWAGFSPAIPATFRIADVPVCPICRKPRANRRGSKTCGSSSCRGKWWRKARKTAQGAEP